MVIISSSSCIDLLEALEELMHNIKPRSLTRAYLDLANLADYFFREYQHDENNKAFDEIPDQILTLFAVVSVILGAAHIHRYALRFSKLYRSRVLERLDDESIARHGEALGIEIEFNRERCFKEVLLSISRNDVTSSICYRYRMSVADYLRVARKLLTEPPWQLTSLTLSRGYVYIDDRSKVLRLLSEYIYNLLSSKLIEIMNSCEDREQFINTIKQLLNELAPEQVDALDKLLKNIATQHEQAIAQSISRTGAPALSELRRIEIASLDELLQISQHVFPPCIRELINSLTRGENLSHHQRFAIATFLINLGVDIEIILKLFSFSPDFNEKIARYQIEHLAGMRGSRKKYLVYSCNTMRTLGLCIDECNVKNPLVYAKRMLASLTKSKKTSD